MPHANQQEGIVCPMRTNRRREKEAMTTRVVEHREHAPERAAVETWTSRVTSAPMHCSATRLSRR